MKLLFVYGTLRPGQYNSNRAGIGETSEVVARNCEANGRMYNLQGLTPIYPVVNFDQAGKVMGDLLLVDENSDSFASIDRMECRAGYDPRTIKVMKPNGEMVEAYAYHYETGHRYGLVGPHIVDGDWPKWAHERD